MVGIQRNSQSSPVRNAARRSCAAISVGRTRLVIPVNAVLSGLDGDRMEYNVVAKLKIYVEDPKYMEKVKKNLSEIAKVSKIWEEDVGFGIKVLKVTFLLNDNAGGMNELEEKVSKLPHVSEYEVEEVGRIG